MFERFSDGARQTMKLATEEAVRCGAKHVDTEHLLAALTNEASETPAIVLRQLGVDVDKVRAQIEKQGGYRPPPPRRARMFEWVGGQRMPQTQGVQDTIMAAMEATRRLGKNIIDSERLLLAMLDVADATAGEILADLSVSADDVRRELARLLCDLDAPDAAE